MLQWQWLKAVLVTTNSKKITFSLSLIWGSTRSEKMVRCYSAGEIKRSIGHKSPSIPCATCNLYNRALSRGFNVWRVCGDGYTQTLCTTNGTSPRPRWGIGPHYRRELCTGRTVRLRRSRSYHVWILHTRINRLGHIYTILWFAFLINTAYPTTTPSKPFVLLKKAIYRKLICHSSLLSLCLNGNY